MTTLLLVASALPAAGQPPRHEALAAMLAPVLPFPRASADGEMPADGQPTARWFVVWPEPEGPAVVTVKANPLHPDTQKASADAAVRIQAAVEAAERRAQASYERALDEIRKGNRVDALEAISLDDEGVEGEKIDAELVLTIEWMDSAVWQGGSSSSPTLSRRNDAAPWIVAIMPNTYVERTSQGTRERFRAAEARVYLGGSAAPAVSASAADSTFTVSPGAPGDSMVVLRGNAALLAQVLAQSEWQKLVSP